MKLVELFQINRGQAVDKVINMLRSDDPALVSDIMVVLQTKGIHPDMDVPEMESILMQMDDRELLRLLSQLEQVTRMG